MAKTRGTALAVVATACLLLLKIHKHTPYMQVSLHTGMCGGRHTTPTPRVNSVLSGSCQNLMKGTWLSGMLADHVGKSQKRVVQLLAVQFLT